MLICPISKEVTTNENPPVLLECGHAISKFFLNIFYRI